MLRKWLPWKYILKRAARRYGFVDPVTLLAKLRRFGHPSEVQEPIELLRAGVVFHARGLINTRAIQYNLDWVWPYWVVRQFKPKDASFIPRGFSFSHVNLTHRNWTAVGHPDLTIYPIIDPRGLATPLFDGWSADVWILSETGELLLPSRQEEVEQTLDLSPVMRIRTSCAENQLGLDTEARVVFTDSSHPELLLKAAGNPGPAGGWLIVSLRPYNPEGIQFIDSIEFDRSANRFRVNRKDIVRFDRAPEKVLFSNYEEGDVAHHLDLSESRSSVECRIGMGTAAAFFPLGAGASSEMEARIPLERDLERKHKAVSASPRKHGRGSENSIPEYARLAIPDSKLRFLYEASARTVLLLTAEKKVFPGPYTYRRFWFRDACFIINALLGIGLSDRSRELILTFSERQTLSGYFQSQKGEWDSNGQVLWLADRFQRLTGEPFDTVFIKSLMKGAEWIQHKRRRKGDGKRHDGLLPAGFSAEHLGPNDYYYWDNFWGVAGLRAAAAIAERLGRNDKQKRFETWAGEFERRIFAGIPDSPGSRNFGALPASPYRRMDAGAIGSLVADYPLRLTAPGDPLIMSTVSFLMEHCFYRNGFFQDMIHSGINIYLTLDIAQTLLRNKDGRYRQLIETSADLASPTGQWPEAINPLTGGGCMGDGQHGWAAAEWLMMMRSLFVREEDDRLIIGSGIFPEWLDGDHEIFFGPTLVPGGSLSVGFRRTKDGLLVRIKSDIRGTPVPCRVEVPGYQAETTDTDHGQTTLTRLA